MKLSIVLPLIPILMLASCHDSGPSAAMGVDGGGQRSVSSQYAKMWHEDFTDQQWVHMLHQRDHQPIAIWSGIRTGELSQSSSGISFTGLTFRNSPSNVLEVHLKQLLQQRPRMFLALFDDPDPEVVLSGVYAYRQGAGELAHLNPGDAEVIADAFRNKLLNHPDVRVRWAAIQLLGYMRQLNADDIRRGLDDETNAIRATTAFWLGAQWDRNVDEKQGQDVRTMLVDEKMRMAPILLEHLNDADFFVRDKTATAFKHLFCRWNADNDTWSTIQSKTFPSGCDWMRADWATRAKTQEAWKHWWAQRGLAELRGIYGIAVNADFRKDQSRTDEE